MQSIFLKAVDIAGTLKISKALAYRLIAEGQIPSLRIGKTVRVRAEDLQKFVEDSMCNIQRQTQPGSSKKDK